jgi:uncharacterized Fe-S cluster-containing radical SAM superfamily enzyme
MIVNNENEVEVGRKWLCPVFKKLLQHLHGKKSQIMTFQPWALFHYLVSEQKTAM